MPNNPTPQPLKEGELLPQEAIDRLHGLVEVALHKLRDQLPDPENHIAKMVAYHADDKEKAMAKMGFDKTELARIKTVQMFCEDTLKKADDISRCHSPRTSSRPAANREVRP